MPSDRTRARRWSPLALLACAASVQALQTIDARDGVATEALLSMKEPTRIRIEGHAITDVFGNLYASRCESSSGSAASLAGSLGGGTTSTAPSLSAGPVNPSGELVVECDRDKGEIYVRPVSNGTKPINLFVSSAQATYTLLLRPADIPADTIVIRDRTARSATSRTLGAPEGPAPSHLRSMKALLVAMAGDRVPPDIRVEEVGRPVQLWTEARLYLARRFEGRDLVGEKYLLQNVSSQPMVLAEQEFDRPDSRGGGRVVAVSIEQHNLLPGASTAVYVIRRSATP